MKINFLQIATLFFIIKAEAVSPLADAGFEADKITKVASKFDYRQSLKYPFFTYHEETHQVPYFNKTGSVLYENNLIRVVPSLHSKSGMIYCSTPNKHANWMVEFQFTVYGRGPSGGRGMVIWYAKDLGNPASQTQTDFYGAPGTFNGLAVVFDNSDLQRNRVNPFIYALTNDGNKKSSDFANYDSPQVHLGACFREYRNTPGRVFGKLIYLDGVLELEIDIRQNGNGYTNCFSTPVQIPVGYQFGVSAETGPLFADDHDIFSFEVYELRPAKKVPKLRPFETSDISQGDSFKMDEELKTKVKKYEEIAEKLQSQEDLVQESHDIQEFAKLEENQFHILEALNLIVAKLGITSSTIKSDDQHIKSEIELLRNDLSSLVADLSSLKSDLSLFQSSINRLQSSLNSIDSRMSHAVDNIHATSANNGSLVKGVAFLAFISVCLILFNMCRGITPKRSKKFV